MLRPLRSPKHFDDFTLPYVPRRPDLSQRAAVRRFHRVNRRAVRQAIRFGLLRSLEVVFDD